MSNLGVMYMTYYRDFEKSMEYLVQADKLATEHNLLPFIPYICNAMANAVVLGDDSEDVKLPEITRLRRKAIDASRKTGDMKVYATTVTGFISDQLRRNRQDAIKDDIDRFMQFTAKADTLPVVTHVRLRCQAVQAYCQGQTEQAVALLAQSATISWDEPLVSRFTSTSLIDAAIICQHAGHYDRALQFYRKALDAAQLDGNLDYTYSIYESMSHVYQEIGDTAQARHYELLYLRDKDSLLVDAHLASVGQVQFRYRLEAVAQDLRHLRERHRLMTIFFITAVAVVLLVGFLLWRLYRAYNKVREAHRHLYERHVELMRRNEEVRQQAEKLAEAEKAAGNKAGLQPVLSRSDAEELLMRIRYVLGNSSEIYTAGFSIGRLAELTESNVKYVSETINSLMGQNFSSLLAEQRVHEACRRMNDREHYGNVTIEAIAESVGIKSRSNFSQVFKRVTGLSPSEYQRMAKAV